MQRSFLYFLLLTALGLSMIAAPVAESYAATETQEDEKTENYFYAEPTYKNFARLYWTLGRLDIKDIHHVDEFMRITECDVYKDYYTHEFEWKKVRASAVDFIEDNKNTTFPVRFEFMQPLLLGQYNIEKQQFEVQDDYKIETTKRFEIAASATEDKGCGRYEASEDYPRFVVVKLSRPFGLESLKMSEEDANNYISDKLRKYNMSGARGGVDNSLSYRDAYLVFKLKIFASKGNVELYVGHELRAYLLAVLEGVEVYADQGKQTMIYAEDFRQTRTKSPLELQYIAEYEAKKAARAAATQAVPDTESAAESEPPAAPPQAN